MNQPLPIITDELIAKEIDEEVILFEKATGRLPHVKIPDRERGKRKQPSSPPLDVHTPLFRILEDKNDTRGTRFARPHTYIEHREKPPEDYTEVEYEVDASDELFMDALNGRLHSQGVQGRGVRTRGSAAKHDSLTDITDDQLEQLIDSFEKEAFFKHGLRQLRDPAATGTLCCVCNDGDFDSGNALIFCNGCNTTVHQQCYGVAHNPHGPWLCRRCESREPTAQCTLCNGRDGALKRTVDDRWVHVLCALYMPEVSFGHPATLEPVVGVDNIPKDKWNKQCSLCNESVGVCVPCDQKDCSTTYHVGCARLRGLYVEARPGQGDSVTLSTYCNTHSLSRLEHYPRYLREYQYDMADTARLASELGLRKEDFEIIYSYWRMKRQVHTPPLLLRLRLLSENGYTPGNSTLSSAEYRVRFVKLRQDFERARMLVDLVRKRELAKRQYIQTFVALFDVSDDLVINPNKRNAAKLL